MIERQYISTHASWYASYVFCMTKTANPATGAAMDSVTSPIVVRAFSSSKAEVRKAVNVALEGSLLVRYCPKKGKDWTLTTYVLGCAPGALSRLSVRSKAPMMLSSNKHYNTFNTWSAPADDAEHTLSGSLKFQIVTMSCRMTCKHSFNV